jgi:hypothetical protein
MWITGNREMILRTARNILFSVIPKPEGRGGNLPMSPVTGNRVAPAHLPVCPPRGSSLKFVNVLHTKSDKKIEGCVKDSINNSAKNVTRRAFV